MLKHPDFLPHHLLLAATRIEIPSGHYLFRNGESSENLHWIMRGELLAIRTTPSGKEAVMMRGRAGEFFAEATLFSENYSCDAIVHKSAVVLCLPLPLIRQTLLKETRIADFFLRNVVMSLRRQCSRVERLRLKSAAERIEHFLSCEVDADGWCQFEQPLSDWAIELGLEPETLYRALRTLEHKKKIDRNGRRLRLLMPSTST